jgi:hypothetical protein
MTNLPQIDISITTPTLNNDGSACALGEVTEYVVQITPAGGAQTSYAFTAPPTWVPGSTQKIPFTSLTPVFSPVVGTSYSVDVEAEDANGVSIPSGSFTWTQGGPTPDAPTNVTVS